MESEGKRDGMIKEAEGEAQVTFTRCTCSFKRRNARVRPILSLEKEYWIPVA